LSRFRLKRRLTLKALDPLLETGATAGAAAGEYSPWDGYVYGRSTADLASAKTNAYSANDDGTLMNVGQNTTYVVILKETVWYVHRSFLKFDTTSIPVDATITSAKLRLYLVYDYSTYADFAIRLQKWTDDEPIGLEDFTAYDGVNYDDGLTNTANMTTSAYNDINIVNFDLIEKGGYTKICVRSSRDIECVGPPAGGSYNEYVRFSTNEGGYPPLLVVTYEVPVAKRIVGDGLVWVVS
jgi:hypothetical protein